MQSSMNTTDDETGFLNKFIVFKQDYLKLRQLYSDVVEEKKILQIKLQTLESRLKLEEYASSSSKIIRQQQEEIIDLLKKKDNYSNLENANKILQKKVQFLESKLRSDRSFYEQEIQSIFDSAENKIREIKKRVDSEAEEKLGFLEKKCQELNAKNEELNVLLETIKAESRSEMDRHNLQYQQEINKAKESKIVVEQENKMLIEKLLQQEALFDQKLKVVEEERKEYYENLKLITRKDTSFQTLNEAFLSNEDDRVGSRNSKIAFGVNPEKRTHSPFVTDENIFSNKK